MENFMKRLSTFLLLITVFAFSCDDDTSSNNTNNANNINNVNNTNNVNNVNNTNNINNTNNLNNINNVNNTTTTNNANNTDVGACTNVADQAIINGTTVDQDAVAGACASGCATSQEFGQCISDCMVTDAGLSEECSDCYGTAADCGKTSCMIQCMAGYESQACIDCIENAGCNSDFGTCSGIPAE
jgi:hypothetical protein